MPKKDAVACSYQAVPAGADVMCLPEDSSGRFRCGRNAPAVHYVTRWGHTLPMCAYHSPYDVRKAE
jgi:hypothetical protein